MTQREIVAKADLALANLTAQGGYLNNEQSNAFIRMMIEQPTMLNDIRVIRMTSPKRDIDKIGFANRILRRAPASGVALAADQRSKPDLGKVTLETSEVIAEVHIPYDVLEDNIERDNLEDTMMELIAERASTDLEELIIQGDVDDTDDYLNLMDGALALSTEHVVDHNNATVTKTLFKQGIFTMPNKYMRVRNQMRNYVAPNQETEYQDTQANRMTILGDKMVETYAPSRAYGVPVVPVALMPMDKGLMTVPQNLILGIQRQIQVETDKDIRARVIIIVLTMRLAFEIEEADAVVLYDNIGTP